MIRTDDSDNRSIQQTRWGERNLKILVEMAQFVHADWLDWSIHISKRHKFVYFDNPKVASGTLKWTLSRLENPDFEVKKGSVHDRKKTPLLRPVCFNDSQLEHILFSGEYFRFAFVRNPFSRLLSAYSQKIGRPQKGWVPDGCELDHISPKSKKLKKYQHRARKFKTSRQLILSRLGRNFDDWMAPITFADFVASIDTAEQEECDPHWRLQSINLPIETAEIDFIGRLETFSGDMKFVLSKIGHGAFDPEKTTELRYSTNARTKIQEMYDQALIDSVAKIYYNDFVNFGYSPEHV